MDEKQLYETKWHDYRHLKPDVATLVFIGKWAERYTEFNEAVGNSRYVSFFKNYENFSLDYLKAKKKAFWKAMQDHRQWALLVHLRRQIPAHLRRRHPG